MSVVAAPARRSGTWMEEPGFGVYVHIPFCMHRCHYCDFNTYEGLDALHLPYVDALVHDIERTGGASPAATSIFVGGGTPTLLPVAALKRIITTVGETVGVVPDAEITVEANPETVDDAYLTALLEAGFTRISIGIQSLVGSVLVGLGRTHGADRALAAIAAARRAGFGDINADLIYGSPWEADEHWRASLAGIVEAAPDHVSAYALTVESGTPLATLVDTGRIADVDPDVQAERCEVAADVLGGAGYERYEISSWARPDHACAHNVLYWSAGDYLGFGAGAHGHLEGRRYWITRRPRDFIAAVEGDYPTESGHESLGQDQRAGEALMLGLRLSSGIEVDGFTRRFGGGSLHDRAAAVDELCAAGLLEHDTMTLRLTARGRTVASEVAARLL